MGRIALYILLAFVSANTLAQVSTGQKRLLKGRLLSLQDSLPVAFAHIYTNEFNEFATTNQLGEFSIRANTKDSIYFSSVGFETKAHLVGLFSGASVRIFYITQEERVLNNVTIYGDTSTIKGLLVPDRYAHVKPITKRTFEQKYPSVKLSNPLKEKLAIKGAFTALANQFNKTYKQDKKLRNLLRNEIDRGENYIELLAQKLPLDFILKHSSLMEDEVKDFIIFWSPEEEFLKKANTYDLVKVLRTTEKAYTQLLKTQDTDSNSVSTLELRKLLEN